MGTACLWLTWDQIMKSKMGDQVEKQYVNEKNIFLKDNYKSQRLVIFQMQTDYHESKELCNSIGGEMIHLTNLTEIDRAVKKADLIFGKHVDCKGTFWIGVKLFK